MSEKKLVLPLSYTNIGDHGGLKTTSARAAVHAPVRPVSTEYWIAGTVHQITVTPYTTYVPSDRLFD